MVRGRFTNPADGSLFKGAATRYHREGAVAAQMCIEEGQVTTLTTTYPDGAKAGEGNIKDGEWIGFLASGREVARGLYADFKKHGIWVEPSVGDDFTYSPFNSILMFPKDTELRLIVRRYTNGKKDTIYLTLDGSDGLVDKITVWRSKATSDTYSMNEEGRFVLRTVSSVSSDYFGHLDCQYPGDWRADSFYVRNGPRCNEPFAWSTVDPQAAALVPEHIRTMVNRRVSPSPP